MQTLLSFRTSWLFFIPLVLLCVLPLAGFSQGVAISEDGSTADGSAMLEVKSTDKGFLPPRMSGTQRNAITDPATGLIVYQTDGTPGYYINHGTPASPAWSLLLPADGDGGSLTNLNASNLASGTVSSARLGSGTANSTTYLRGDGTWATPSGGSSVSTTTVRFIICVDGLFPSGSMSEHFIGEIIMFAGPTNWIPSNFMECKGQLLSTSAYSALYAILGTTYGGNGSSTFALPNLSGKVPTGY